MQASKPKRPFVRLYRFMRAEHALAAIEHRELRVSRINELNDPFEFYPAIASHPDIPYSKIEQAIRDISKHYDDTIGIVCMSKAETINDPVMWGHYAQGHKGIALGFDVWAGPEIVEMKYPKERPILNAAELKQMSETERLGKFIEVLTAKAPNWVYESEHRFLVQLSNCKIRGGHYFTPIPDDFLKHVVLGIKSSVSATFVEDLLHQSNFKDVSVSQATPSTTNFNVIV